MGPGSILLVAAHGMGTSTQQMSEQKDHPQRVQDHRSHSVQGTDVPRSSMMSVPVESTPSAHKQATRVTPVLVVAAPEEVRAVSTHRLAPSQPPPEPTTYCRLRGS